MKALVLNGSPKPNGTVGGLLKLLAENLSPAYRVEWINVYDLKVRPCFGCMKCRPDGECVLPPDDGQTLGQKIREAQLLLIGSPVYWANMSSPLKAVFDRNVPAFIGETPGGMPKAKNRGKNAALVTACATPEVWDFLAGESRGALRALKEILRYSGFKIVGCLVKSGTRSDPVISDKLKKQARKLANRL